MIYEMNRRLYNELKNALATTYDSSVIDYINLTFGLCVEIKGLVVQ